MTRRRLILVSSLLLTLGVATLWVRSCRTYDHFWYSPAPGLQYSCTVRGGYLLVSRSHLTNRTTNVFSDTLDRGPGRSYRSTPAPPQRVSPFTDDEGSPRWVQFFGFDHLHRTAARPGYGNHTFRRIVIPLWFPTALLALPLIRRLLRRRRPAHLCPACSYDIRATPERCPECGKVASPGR
jgi:hypothetical protein